MKKALKWLAFGFVGLVGLLAALYVVGMFLPERYETQVVFKINKSPEAVWAAVADFEKHPIVGASRRSTRRLPDENGLPVWIEDMGETGLKVRVVESHPPHHIKCVFSDLVVTSMSASSETQITADGGGSLVTTKSETVAGKGTWHIPIFRVILSFTGAQRKGIMDYWKSIGRTLGEEPQFEK
jgi:hypothetical protein